MGAQILVGDVSGSRQWQKRAGEIAMPISLQAVAGCCSRPFSGWGCSQQGSESWTTGQSMVRGRFSLTVSVASLLQPFCEGQLCAAGAAHIAVCLASPAPWEAHSMHSWAGLGTWVGEGLRLTTVLRRIHDLALQQRQHEINPQHGFSAAGEFILPEPGAVTQGQSCPFLGSAANGACSGFSVCYSSKLLYTSVQISNSSLFVLRAAATCRRMHHALFCREIFNLFFFLICFNLSCCSSSSKAKDIQVKNTGLRFFFFPDSLLPSWKTKSTFSIEQI